MSQPPEGGGGMDDIAAALVAEGPETLTEFLGALDLALQESQGISLEQFMGGADLEEQGPPLNAEAPMPPAGADGRGRVVLR